MLDTLKWQIRSWEHQGRFPYLTRAATWLWVSLHNARDRMMIGRIDNAIRTGEFPGEARAAAREVCQGALGAGIRPMQDEAELAGLIEQVGSRQPRTVLEIGTARGGTLLLLCRFAAPDATIVSVDLPYGRNGGGYPVWKEAHYRGFTGPGQTLHLLRADSHSPDTVRRVSELLGGRPVDFMLIDADHSYEGVRQDYYNYRPLLAEGGLLALHDILPNDIDPSIDVNRFWQELESDPDVRTEKIVTNPDQGMYGIGLVTP